MARKSLPVITITIIMLLVLATAGVAYGLWSESLVIDGTVYTGEVDVAFSGPYPYEYVNVNGRYMMEPRVKDPYAECYARAWDFDPGSDGLEGIEIYVEGAYPGYVCLISFDIHNLGTVPVHVTHPYGETPEWVDVHVCYANWHQLHPGEAVWGYIWIEFDNYDGVEELGQYGFHLDVDALQWNEAPVAGSAALDCSLPEGFEAPAGFLQ